MESLHELVERVLKENNFKPPPEKRKSREEILQEIEKNEKETK